LGYGGEDLGRRHVTSDQRGHAAQRCLFGATRLGGVLRLPQLGIEAPALRHVPGDAVDDALIEHGPAAPLEPPLGSVGADEAALEPGDVVSAEDVAERLA
jgi:hypothetical protein